MCALTPRAASPRPAARCPCPPRAGHHIRETHRCPKIETWIPPRHLRQKPEIEDKKADQEEDDGSGKVLSALDKIADALGGLAGRIDALETAREEHALQC